LGQAIIGFHLKNPLGGYRHPAGKPPPSLEDTRRLVERYVEHYNNVRPNSAISITPKGHAHRALTLDPRR
jgi:hypothetical protein